MAARLPDRASLRAAYPCAHAPLPFAASLRYRCGRQATRPTRAISWTMASVIRIAFIMVSSFFHIESGAGDGIRTRVPGLGSRCPASGRRPHSADRRTPCFARGTALIYALFCYLVVPIRSYEIIGFPSVRRFPPLIPAGWNNSELNNLLPVFPDRQNEFACRSFPAVTLSKAHVYSCWRQAADSNCERMAQGASRQQRSI